MKKKAIKLATSTAIAATAFVAGAPVQKADAAVNVDQLVTDAQNAGTVLKWAISVEGSADFVTQPWAQYNAAKAAVAAAEKAIKGLSFSDKIKQEAKLVDAKLQVKRGGAYIDAITSSNKIKDLTADLVAAEKSGDLEKVEAAYHKATAEYRKQAALLDRVYGQSTRDEIRNAVKPALEKAVAGLKNEVTVHMLVKAAAADVKAGNYAEADKKLEEAQAIIDANKNIKFKDALVKSVDDAVKSVPAYNKPTVDGKEVIYSDLGRSEIITATFKDKNGKVNDAFVTVKAQTGLKIVSANGVVPTTTDTVTVKPNSAGQVVVIVTAADEKVEVLDKKVEFYHGDTKATESKAIYFFEDKYVALDEKTPVEYVAPDKSFFIIKDTTNGNRLEKIKLKSNDVYQDEGKVVSADVFKANVSKGSIIFGSYNKGTSGSVFNLYFKKSTGYFEVDQDTTIRVESTRVTFSGTGEAGKKVVIYGKDNGKVKEVIVGSNGKWSTDVLVSDGVDGVFYIDHITDLGKPVPTKPSDDAVKNPFTVQKGAFEVNVGGDSDSEYTGTLFGKKLVLTVSNTSFDDVFVIDNNASITIVDGMQKKATFTNGVNRTSFDYSADKKTLTITFGTTTVGLKGDLAVDSFNKVTNKAGFALKPAGLLDGSNKEKYFIFTESK